MTAEVLKYTLEQVEALELAPGTEHQKLEGWIPEFASDEDIRQSLEKAFDYRGDVTMTSQVRRKNRSPSSSIARLAPRSPILMFSTSRPKLPRSAKSAMQRSRASNSPAKTAQPASTGKTGSRPTTRKEQPARNSLCTQRPSSSRP